MALVSAVSRLRDRRSALRWVLAGAIMLWFAPQLRSATNSPATTPGRAASGDALVLPKGVPDPLEPCNRALWAFNRSLLSVVIKPSAKVYRAIVRKPVRQGIANFNRNITYPGRLLNNVLQGRWRGARDETDRFFVNTVAGGAGFVDVATRVKIPKSDADFGQTLGKWGWHNPRLYLMLPVFGPSNERDTIGLGVDTAASPLSYVTPFPFDPTDPLTYFSPYTYYSISATYNELADSVDSHLRAIAAEKDAYATLRYAWTFARATEPPDFRIRGDLDPATLETLQSALVSAKDPDFPRSGKTRSVWMRNPGRTFDFTYWFQKTNAPVVYIVPGIGSHRLADLALALAELCYNQGFSVVTVSNPYNYEFIERASTTALPAYTPTDAHDLHTAITEIDRRLQWFYPRKLGPRYLMGYSMGAFQTLYLASNTGTNTDLVPFHGFIAIDTPVRLLHGLSTLDNFYQAPLAWPAEERTARLRNTFVKVAALANGLGPTNAAPPFDAVESKFLVGMAFRFILRDVIFTTQQKRNLGVLKRPLWPSRRTAVYEEIAQYSFTDYFQKFATPYYQAKGIDLTDPTELAEAADLRSHGAALQNNSHIRVLVNGNDFLLEPEDRQWLEATFGEHLTTFEHGGHLGNLGQPAVQKEIAAALKSLRGMN